MEDLKKERNEKRLALTIIISASIGVLSLFILIFSLSFLNIKSLYSFIKINIEEVNNIYLIKDEESIQIDSNRYVSFVEDISKIEVQQYIFGDNKESPYSVKIVQNNVEYSFYENYVLCNNEKIKVRFLNDSLLTFINYYI